MYLCGGSLINRRYVVTAAHCTDEVPEHTNVVEVVLGEFDAGEDPDPGCPGCPPVQRFDVDARRGDIVVHPDYDAVNPLGGADIALIRLPRLAKTSFEDVREVERICRIFFLLLSLFMLDLWCFCRCSVLLYTFFLFFLLLLLLLLLLLQL